ncbi:hypothetical protein NLG97_g2458 [Lecanicillium saksenae]|uniref:Uncharacterized protein n=1 Tax=Lecanicillium saksenae TaxID=468837 RepID=A0ACC1R4X2_9HYPO|nr:hypothetical protein NLG97_g2458 [Lecanicillium saksenae]
MDSATGTSSKEQPWKKLFETEGANSTSKSLKNSHLAGKAVDPATAAPWQEWTPDPAHPDNKPWTDWMNDSRFHGKALIKQAATDLKEKERGRERARVVPGRGRTATQSPQGTVAEGG